MIISSPKPFFPHLFSNVLVTVSIHNYAFYFCSIPPGYQDETHPHPGRPFYSTVSPQTFHLPNSPKGALVVDLLRVAFNRGLLFTIFPSSISGRDEVMTWTTGVRQEPAKTYCENCDQSCLENDYLDSCLRELAARGVNPADLVRPPR